MIIMHVTYTLQGGVKQTDFYQALEQGAVIARTSAEDGCIEYRFFYPAEGDDQVFLLEMWEDAEKMAAHKTTEQYRLLQHVKARCVADSAFQQYTL
jgi:quinol monooxygenase YgiN